MEIKQKKELTQLRFTIKILNHRVIRLSIL